MVNTSWGIALISNSRRKEIQKRYRETHKKEIKKRNKEYRKRNREKLVKYNRERRWKIKKEIFELLGNCCKRCGFEDKRALQIDHVHGNGNKEFKKFRNAMTYYFHVLKKIRKGSKDYQLLCANCNWIKRHEKNEERR